MEVKKEAICKTIIEIAPDDLMLAARSMHVAATKAQPGQHIMWDLGQGITLKYDPKIKINTVNHVTLPGTAISSKFENSITNAVKAEDSRDAVSH